MHLAKKDAAAPPAQSDVTRRSFLKGGVLAGVAGGVGVGAAYFGYSMSARNPVRVGIIGTGLEGGVLIGALNPNYLDVVAIADIRPFNVHRAFHGDGAPGTDRIGLIKKYGYASEKQARKHITVHEAGNTGYDELLKDPRVEAVIIALPLHLHAPASIAAMQAGKHVLCEKLMAHNVKQCKEMAQTAQDTGKLLAIGHQRHYSVLYDNAAQLIRRGLIGQVHYIRAQWFRGNLPLPGKDSWKPDLPEDVEKELAKLDKETLEALKKLAALQTRDKPAWDSDLADKRDKDQVSRKKNRLLMLDKDVDAKKYGYQARPPGKYPSSALEELIRWRLWDRTGAGLMAELGSHQLDAASIFVSALRDDGKKVHPLTVTAVGGRHIFPHDRDVEDHVYCTYEFPGPEYYGDFDKRTVANPNKKIVVTYSSINGNGFGNYGEVVMGTKGTMIVDGEQELKLILDEEKAPTSVEASKESGPVVNTTESGGPQAARKLGGDGPISRGYTEEMEHWAWCIRNPAPENKPRCHPQVAMADAVIALVSNYAFRQPQLEGRVEFKPEWFDVDHPANPEDDLKVKT